MKPVCLIVLDGWGISQRKEGNAMLLAKTPVLDRLYSEYPWTTLETSGIAVGLPEGQMGNSEVGHLTMGAGRVIYQELTRITKAIREGEFERKAVLTGLMERLKGEGGALHLLGLVSDGGVHSHMTHLFALLDCAKKMGLDPGRVHVHAFLDGRDTPPKSGANYIKALRDRMEETGFGRVSTVSGRYYAMDRDRRWERVRKAYAAIALGEGLEAGDPVSAVTEAYGRGETDEFVLPTVIKGPGEHPVTVSDGDGILFFNFRADRARELTEAFIKDEFDGFERPKRPRLSAFVTMTEYDARWGLPVLFPPQEIKNILGEVLSKVGIGQFRVSETEKYAHVTFFFNGGQEKPFPGEERLLIPSVKDVPTYDKKPEMRAREIAQAVVKHMEDGRSGFILINFANGDMVGHTGVLEAAVKACEVVDEAVGRVTDAALGKGWVTIITSDHGNAEQMIGREGSAHTAHTLDPVPFIIVSPELKGAKLRRSGGLKDVAPTVLKIMGIEKPPDMEGEPLFEG